MLAKFTNNWFVRVRQISVVLQTDSPMAAVAMFVIEAVGLPETFRVAVERWRSLAELFTARMPKRSVSCEIRLLVQREPDIMESRNATPNDFHGVIRVLRRVRFPVDDAITSIVS